MTKLSIEFCIVFALKSMRCTTDRGRLIPLKQSHLLIDVNECRKKNGMEEINMDQLARALSNMKSKGIISRIN
jgi:hypothetical protein